jgi:NAD(P)-dependent dehydrogenase (short-subunit alcohol dehydrogenase family)
MPELAHPLDGLENLLPLTEGVALPHRAPAASPPTVGESDQFDAELLRQIANERVSMREVARLSVPAPLKAWPRLGRMALSLLVLLAALTPFFSGGLTRSLVQPRPDVAALAREVAALPREATLLLSFDYGPTYAGEITPLALALVRQLAQRGVRVVVMSTRAEGVGVAESVYRAIAAEQPDYRYGESYVILGYLPGQEAGLRALVTGFSQAFKTDYRQRRPLSDFAATRMLASLQDVERVIVFAEDSQTVRRWVEQVQGRVPAQPQGRSYVTLDALVAAEAEPLLVPYQRSGQLHHLIGCASGASEYEVASAAPAEALRRTDAYVALFLVVVVAMLAGNVAYVAQGRRKR